MRLIDADALKKEIRENDPFGGMNYEWYIDHAPTIAASPWRRVEDELPEIGKRVLVSYGGDVQILKRTDSMTYDGKNYWWNEADGLWERVEEGSYWMPIEPPKEE